MSTDRVAIREICGNLTATVDTVTAWYVIPAKTWSFTSSGRRSDLVLETARRLASLAGTRDIHMRVTSRPYPVPLWAKHLDDITHAGATGDLPGCAGNTWYDHLENAQRHLHRQTLADKEVYLGVPVTRRRRIDRLGEKWVERGLRKGEIESAKRVDDEVEETVRGAGLDGRRATADEVEWLLRRSVALLMPAPQAISPVDDPRWEPDDMASFTDSIDYETRHNGKTVKIIDTDAVETDPATGEPVVDDDGNVKFVTRHVAVLTLGRIGNIDIPEAGQDHREQSDPWLQLVDRLPFPVELSARYSIVPGHVAKAEVEKAGRILLDQARHFQEHDREVPPDIARKGMEATRVADEMADGEDIVSTRVYGWWRIAVSGKDEAECLTRCRQVRDLYKKVHFTLEHPRPGQYGLVREFIPGEPLGSTAYQRRMPVLYAAAALPQVTATVGDRRGDYIGYTASTSRRPVMFDPHYGPEVREVSGFVPIVGEPGAGKSVLLGWLCYLEARRGVTTTLLDPGGPLAGLTHLPELAAVSRHYDLLHGAPGSLNPATVVPTPTREAYPGDKEYRGQLAIARNTRKMLMRDVAASLLPEAVSRMPETKMVLSEAVRATSGERSSSLFEVVGHLEKLRDKHGKAVAGLLREMSEMPQAALMFPADETLDADTPDATFVVFTMEGLTIPDSRTPREAWSTEEQLAQPLLHLATYYSTRRIYGLPKRQRKCAAFDELGQMGDWRSGRALVTGLGRGSRKWNTAVFASSQNPEDILGMNIANFLRVAFAGRIEDETIAGEALRMFRIPERVGYESVLHGLSPQHADLRRVHREFLMRDIDGFVEKVRVDMTHMAHVLAAQDSTPDPTVNGARPREMVPA